jgi:hypothetical protein
MAETFFLKSTPGRGGGPISGECPPPCPSRGFRRGGRGQAGCRRHRQLPRTQAARAARAAVSALHLRREEVKRQDGREDRAERRGHPRLAGRQAEAGLQPGRGREFESLSFLTSRILLWLNGRIMRK